MLPSTASARYLELRIRAQQGKVPGPAEKVEGWLRELRWLSSPGSAAEGDRGPGAGVARGDRALEDAVDGFAAALYESRSRDSRMDLRACSSATAAAAATREREAANRALNELGADRPSAAAGAANTTRAREVLILLARGLTNRQLAEQLVERAHRPTLRHEHPADAPARQPWRSRPGTAHSQISAMRSAAPAGARQ